MNVALVATGSAVVVIAASLCARRLADRGSAFLMAVAGLALAAGGVITQNVSYSWNITATVVFMTLGSVSALVIAVSTPAEMSGERRGVAVIAGLTALFGYLVYAGGHDIFGPGGAQRLCVYGILVAVIAIGTAGFVPGPVAATADDDARTQDLVVGESR